ncbi:enoyl-CoA hydratase/isomerase family protein [Silicimonas algicola]|uniref:Enoyl-CoA hydratase/carnithine racemase n=1 Tax=Silicimonas algicola TaxID=1826607 RepID=A0A316GIG5_9RHOB|nr:enoyl-CoA hydratase/isomerase family protein [Silicimonas algicola]AZQ68286.1 enoyl-CoA hydratase/isomerase family protein [Silicimonas algicola]PWK54577.1 enoyl-CoA hydratase/carnithine racemase [Silicimonas algicola]
MPDVLTIETRGPVRILTMNRPDKLNALDTALTRALCDALDAAAGDAQVRALVLSGAGRAFCAGADTGEFRDLVPGQGDRVADRASLTARLHRLLRAVPQPIVSAVHGAAVGGGAGLAIGCDMAVAAEGTRFGYPELRHDLVPALVMTNLVRQMGRKLAFELVATGRMLSAAEMLAAGLVNRVVPDGDALAAALDLAEICARPKPIAMEATKRLFHEVAEAHYDAAMEAGLQANIAMRGYRDGP